MSAAGVSPTPTVGDRTDAFLDALRAHGSLVREKRTGDHLAQCPAHADHDPSLWIRRGDVGVPLFQCRAGCDKDAILAAIGWTREDVRAKRDNGAAPPSRRKPDTSESLIELTVLGAATPAQADYLAYAHGLADPRTLERVGAQLVRNDRGEWLALPVLATEPRQHFKLLAVDGAGNGRLNGKGKLKRESAGGVSLLFSPDLLAEDRPPVERLHCLEGETDWLAAVSCGMQAVIAGTGGAGPIGYDRHETALLALAPGEVVVWPDRDKAGRDGARELATWWRERGYRVRVPEPPEALGDKGDVRDYLLGRPATNGTGAPEPLGGPADLDALADEFPVLEPLDVAQPDATPREAKDGPAPLHILTADEFWNDEAPEAIVDGLIYRASTHLLTGASKSGKSWAAYQIAAACATGSPFLGIRTERVRVLLISLEMIAGLVAKRIRELCENVGLPLPVVGEDLFVIAPTRERIESLNLLETQGRDRLKRAIDDTGAELVVFDTLYKFAPGADPSDNAEMGVLFGNLGDDARETGTAFLMLDHVRKGDAGDSVSQSAIGAQIKGGASNVIMALRRTAHTGAMAWELGVESHFGSRDEPLTYTRPERPDGSHGGGCVPCSATEARGISFATVRELFERQGELADDGRRYFRSKRALIQGLQAAGITPESSTSMAEDAAAAIERDLCAPERAVAGEWKQGRPIWTSDGPRGARVYTWRLAS